MQLQELRENLEFELDIVDIEGSPELEETHGRRIPVLEADGVELCNFYLDQQALLNHLERRRSMAI